MATSPLNGYPRCLTPVFKTRMAFVIPLGQVRDSVSRKITESFKPKTHFVSRYNVSAHYIALTNTIAPKSYIPSASCSFNSKPSGRGQNFISRSADFSFYLLKYALKGVNNQQFALIMLADLDFATLNLFMYELITPHDISYLQGAVLAKNGLLSDSIKQIVREITPPISYSHLNEIEIKGIVINIKAHLVDTTLLPVRSRLESDLRNSFNSSSRNVIISSFLKTDMSDYMRPHDTAYSDMERWVYGLLYNNGNFMMADDSVVRETVSSYYSNNFVERYWASPTTVLTIKTSHPFLDSNPYNGNNDFCDFDSLVESCLLITINQRIETLLCRHGSMTYHEIEQRKAEIASFFNYTVNNLVELDRKLQFFIQRSNLPQRYERVLGIVTPRSNIIVKYRSELIAIVSVIITLLSLITTILTLIINR